MKPKRIFLIRHGESEGNVDKSIYTSKPDYALNLTPKGIEQAREAGRKIKSIIGPELIGFYYSPFFRTRQTQQCLEKELFGNVWFTKEEPRLREQEWSGKLRDDGHMEDVQEERDAYGHFYYRFDGGESCADVLDRVSDFFHTLFRDFEKETYPDNIGIVSHGMTNRLFLMRWFHAKVEEFESWRNPKNCEIWQMDRQMRDLYGRIPKNPKYNLVTAPTTWKRKCQFPYTPLALEN